MARLHLFRNEEEAGLLNWANAFTVGRVFAAPYIILLWNTDNRLAAIITLMVAFWTDFFDGVIARMFNCKTVFGAKLDPTADWLLVFIALWLAIANLRSGIEPYLLLGVLALQLMIGGWCTFYELRRGYTVTVTWAGKKSAFARMTCIAWLLMSGVGEEWFYASFSWWLAVVMGFTGIFLGFVGFIQYVGQVRSRVDPEYWWHWELYPLGYDQPVANFLRDPFGLKARFGLLKN